ncbi:MAG: glutathione S-transferase N-terminal domain-containing protein [Gammaproteobacteria bacterium]|jgi:glutathione S-transferase
MPDSTENTSPTLFVFAISHYCEKARWALDRAGISYRLKYLAPGLHRRTAKKLGARYSSVPILLAGKTLQQGSSAILDWAESNRTGGAPTLNPGRNSTPEEYRHSSAHTDFAAGDEKVRLQREGRQIEKRLDDVLGVHIRRYFYSEALIEYPRTVKAVFAADLSGFPKLYLELAWGAVRRIMIERMDLGSMQGLQSRQILEQELDWLDGLLADGRPFLTGDHFSRVDMAAASLLAPLVRPEQHPTYRQLELPPNVALDCESWALRPCLQWSLNLYRDYRQE